VISALRLTTADDFALEAELALPDSGDAHVGVVLCHPHPLYGGSMNAGIVGPLFAHLAEGGAAVLRFNFRGVEGSEGLHDHGGAERLDVVAALDALVDALGPAVPIVLAGWSFGGNVALSVDDPRVTAWLAFAPTLHGVPAPAATDPRPRLLVLAQHDEYRDAAEVVAEVASWANTEVDVIGGASHFFVGRYDRVLAVAQSFVTRAATGG
jgi:alpha/beta superfamily hydrolase